MKTYYITLEPLEPFFFGMEKMAEVGNRNNYYQKSSFYPQQTAVLGMFRFVIGKLNNFKKKLPITDKFDSKIIGEKSFELEGTSKGDFRSIQGLSPVFIVRGNEKFFHAPFDSEYQVEFDTTQAIFFNEIQKNIIPKVIGYNAKKGLKKQLISKKGDKIPLIFQKEDASDGVFEARPRDGNEKSKQDKEKENGYYKFEYITMHDACFGCFLTLNQDFEFDKGYSEIVNLGGESSPFKLTVEDKFDKDVLWQSYYAEIPNQNYYKVILLSDTYIKPQTLKIADFNISETVSFRNLKTSLTETKNWSGFSRNRKDPKGQPTFSERYNLISKGSVFYFLDENTCQSFENELNTYQNFQQIGYNQYLTIRINSKFKQS